MSEYVIEITDDDDYDLADRRGLFGLGDYAGQEAMFWSAAASKGIGGNELREIIKYFIPIANNASDNTKYPFMYEVNSRAELQRDDKVPSWLLDQIKSRVQSIVTNTGMSAGAEGFYRVALQDFLAGKFRSSPSSSVTSGAKPTKAEKAAAPALVSAKAIEERVKAAEGKQPGGIPWMLIGAGAAALVGIALIWSAFRPEPTYAPAAATAGLWGTPHKRRRRGRRS